MVLAQAMQGEASGPYLGVSRGTCDRLHQHRPADDLTLAHQL